MSGCSWAIALSLFILLAAVGCGAAPTVAPAAGATASPRGAILQSPMTSSPPRIGSPSAIASPARGMGDQSGFADQLRSKGLTVEYIAEASQPFLRTVGARLRLSSGALAQPIELQAYTYDDPALAAEDAARVQPDTGVRWTERDGNVRTISFACVAPPHFFRRERVLVLYTGTDPAVLALLTDLLGAQFAGR